MNREENTVYQRQWRENNREKVSDIAKHYRRNLKLHTIDAYGGKCACCGEATLEFLVIDHINGEGNQDRKRRGSNSSGTGFYQRLKNAGFPKGEYRVLCYNCNNSIGLWGYCPHSTTKEGIG